MTACDAQNGRSVSAEMGRSGAGDFGRRIAPNLSVSSLESFNCDPRGMIQMIPSPGRPFETLKLRSASARSLAATHPCDLLHAVVRFAGNHIMDALGAAAAPWPCALSSRFVVYLFFSRLLARRLSVSLTK